MKLVLTLCIFCAVALRGFALDREAFTFTKYDLSMRVEPEQQRLAVRGKITVRNDSAVPQSNLALQISSSLDWRSIRANGKPVHFVTEEYNSDIDHTGALSEAIVSLGQEIPAQGTVELEVGYEGVIPLDVSRLTRVGVPQDKAKHTDWDQISRSFTAVRGIGYVTWYPVATEDASLSEGNSVAETIGRWQAREANAEMVVTLQSTWATPMFSGTAEGTDSSSSRAGKFRMALGMAVPTFVIADYEKLAPKGDKGVSVYYLGGGKERAETYAEAAEKIEPIFSAKDERRALNIIALSDSDAQPFVTEGMLLTALNSPMTNAAELSIAYAKARQLVRSPRAWIQDGLAHFAQADFVGKQKGRQSGLDYLQSHRAALIEAEKTPAASSDQESSRSLINAPDDLYLQVKAMYVWWMLRDMLENGLFDALRSYEATEDKDPAYLPGLIAKQSNRDLRWFFDDWVYHDRGLPDFRVTSVFSSPVPSGGFLVTITVENVGNAGAEVPLTLTFEGGETRRRVEVRGKSKASTRIESAGAPLQVTVNDGSVPESDVTNNTYKVDKSLGPAAQ